MDGDGVSDLLDADADGDGVSNVYELQATDDDDDYDPFDAESTPPDADGDGVPNSIDDDDDDDSFPDDVEEERGSDPLDPDDTPLTQYPGGGVYYVPGEGFVDGYDPEGYELSMGSLMNLFMSEFIIPIFLAIGAFFLLLRKRMVFKGIKGKIMEISTLFELNKMEDEIDDLIQGKKITIEHGLLLRNLFERRQDEIRGLRKEKDGSSPGTGSDTPPTTTSVTEMVRGAEVPGVQMEQFGVAGQQVDEIMKKYLED
jgi:hypothetical protein